VRNLPHSDLILSTLQFAWKALDSLNLQAKVQRKRAFKKLTPMPPVELTAKMLRDMHEEERQWLRQVASCVRRHQVRVDPQLLQRSDPDDIVRLIDSYSALHLPAADGDWHKWSIADELEQRRQTWQQARRRLNAEIRARAK